MQTLSINLVMLQLAESPQCIPSWTYVIELKKFMFQIAMEDSSRELPHILVFSRVHATLQPAMSVSPSVCRSIRNA